MEVVAVPIAPHHGHGHVGVGVHQAGHQDLAHAVDHLVKGALRALRADEENLVPLHGDKGALENGAGVVHEDGGDILKKYSHKRLLLFCVRIRRRARVHQMNTSQRVRGQGCLGTQTRLAR